MRKIIVQEFITLHGFIEDTGDQGMTWVTNNFNEELAKEIAGWATDVDALLLGRTTYEILAAYWPTDIAKELDPVMSKHMNSSTKFVFSKTLNAPDWNNSITLNDIDADQIQKIKHGPGKNIAVSGSASVANALMNLDLIDKYQLMVFPLAIGKGKPLFKDLRQRQNLELVKFKTFKNGVITLYYNSVKN